MSLLWITKAEYINDFKISIQFNTDEKGTVDFKNKLDKKIFEPLKNETFFKNFKLNKWTIDWENGADFSPEFLYNRLEKIEP